MPEDKQSIPEDKKVIEVDQDNKKVVNVDNLPISKMRISLALFFSLIAGTITIVFLIAKTYYGFTQQLDATTQKTEELSQKVQRYEDSKGQEINSDVILTSLKNVNSTDCDFYKQSIQCLTEKKKSLNCQ